MVKYSEYKQALTYLQGSLGLQTVDFLVREELADPITDTVKWLNEKLILLGDDSSIKAKLQVVFDAFDYGADKIIWGKAQELKNEVSDPDGEDGDNILDGEGDNLDEDGDVLDERLALDRFIFSWSNIMTSLCLRLKIQYSSLLYTPPTYGCTCACGEGETWKDIESWSSGVWPEDETMETLDLLKDNNNPCGCAGQRLV